jgi:hypothetical protein
MQLRLGPPPPGPNDAGGPACGAAGELQPAEGGGATGCVGEPHPELGCEDGDGRDSPGADQPEVGGATGACASLIGTSLAPASAGTAKVAKASAADRLVSLIADLPAPRPSGVPRDPKPEK